MKREKKFHLSTGTHSDVHALGELGHEADLRNQQKSCEHDFTEWNEMILIITSNFVLLFFFYMVDLYLLRPNGLMVTLFTPQTLGNIKEEEILIREALSLNWKVSIPESAKICPNHVLELLMPQRNKQS